MLLLVDEFIREWEAGDYLLCLWDTGTKDGKHVLRYEFSYQGEIVFEGFVCPEWAIEHWSINECTVEKCTSGQYAVIDHSIQTAVFLGTQDECNDFVNGGMDHGFHIQG